MRDDVTMTITGPDGATSAPFKASDMSKAARAIEGVGRRMRETPEDRNVRTTLEQAAGAELRAFIERVERLAAEQADIADAVKEVYAEAKGRGYSPKILRKVVAMRKRDADDLAEEAAVLQLYLDALGM